MTDAVTQAREEYAEPTLRLSTGIEIGLRSHRAPDGAIYAMRVGSVRSNYWLPREIRNAEEFDEVILSAMVTPITTEDRARALAWYAGLEAAGRKNSPNAAAIRTEERAKWLAVVEAARKDEHQQHDRSCAWVEFDGRRDCDCECWQRNRDAHAHNAALDRVAQRIREG